MHLQFPLLTDVVPFSFPQELADFLSPLCNEIKIRLDFILTLFTLWLSSRISLNFIFHPS